MRLHCLFLFVEVALAGLEIADMFKEQTFLLQNKRGNGRPHLTVSESVFLFSMALF